MKQTKLRFALFSSFDRSKIERYLEKQAQNGWMLDWNRGAWWHFHRIEPQKLHFSVAYFPKASALDVEPTDAQQEFVDLCKHSGWKLAASDVWTLYFYSTAENPTPIETDPVLELSTIRATAKKEFLLNSVLFLVLIWCCLAIGLTQFFRDPVRTLSSISLYTGVEWLLMFVFELTNLTAYLRWYRRAKAAAALDQHFTEMPSNKVRVPVVFLLALCLLLSFFKLVENFGWKWTLLLHGAQLLGIAAVALLISKWIKRKENWSLRRKRIASGIVIFGSTYLCVMVLAFSVLFGAGSSDLQEASTECYEYEGAWYEIRQDPLPLCVEDLADSSGEGYSKEMTRDATILMAFEQGRQYPRLDRPEQPELAYSITTVKLPLLYDWCKEVHLKDISNLDGYPRPESARWVEHTGAYHTVDPAPWLAREAYQLWINGEAQTRFLLCYDDHFVNISFRPAAAWNLTSEQMQRVGEKLGSKNSKER